MGEIIRNLKHRFPVYHSDQKHLWTALSILPSQVSRGDFADRLINIFKASTLKFIAYCHGHLEILSLHLNKLF